MTQKRSSLSIEKTAQGYLIQNNNPVTINMPFTKRSQAAELRLYNNGELVFKIEQAYEKVEIVF